MEAFLDAASSSQHCASLGHLQQELVNLLASRVTPTKAQHISVTFELRSNVTFAVPVTDAENAALEAGGSIDPQLAGARAGSTVSVNGGQATRHIKAIDTVMNQSQDDPVVQRIVAKHVMSGVGDADQAQWIVRSMNRGTQGWTFTYGCKDSASTWARQNAKNQARTVVGEWSGKDGLDPVNLSRPAFDCRGTLTIAFSKTDKAITVKYEHTNMHKTVGELMDLLAPSPAQERVIKLSEMKKSIPKKAPKQRKTTDGQDGAVDGQENGEQGATPRPKKRRKPVHEDDGSIRKKPRKKKKNGDAQGNPALGMLPPEMPGALPVGDATGRGLYNTQAPQQDGVGASSDYPEALIRGVADGTIDQATAMVSSSVHLHSISIVLPAGEPEKRREEAIRLLTKHDIDPRTLSAEQFSILANQSPALQADSLRMLKQYGAERLRIVVPDNDGSMPQDSTTSNATQAAQQIPVADVHQPDVSPKKTRKKQRGGRNKESDAADVSMAMAVAASTNAGSRQKKPKLSRGSCTPCRTIKIKCNRKKPSCDKCLKTGTSCQYPLEIPRKSTLIEEGEEADKAAEPTEVAEAVEAVEAAEAAEAAEETEDTGVDEDGEREDLPSPGFSYEVQQGAQNQDSTDPQIAGASESVPIQDNPRSTYEDPSIGIYHHSSGLTFPNTISPEVTPQMWNAGGSTDYNQSPAHTAPTLANVGLSLPAQHIQQTSTALSFPEQTGTTSASTSSDGTHQLQKSWGSYTSSQRSSAADLPATTGSLTVNATSHAGTSWPKYSTSEPTNTKDPSSSPGLSRRTAKQANPPSFNSPKLLDGAAVLAAAAMNSVARTSSPAQNTQYEAAAAATRAKSRQGLRPQTRTPVPSHASASTGQSQRSTPSGVTTANYSSGADKAAATTNYNSSYSHYTTTDQSSHGVAYQPYSQQNTTSTTSYPNYAQQAVSSYTSSSPSTASQWGDTSSSQGGNHLAYNNTSSSTSGTPYLNMRPQSSQRSQNLQSFNVRPQPRAQAQSRSSASTSYGQQTQQPQLSLSASSGRPRQQTSPNDHQSGWYTGSSSGYGTGAAKSTSAETGYSASNSSSTNGGSSGHYDQHQHQQQHPHHAMNLSGHAYNSLDGTREQSIYNLLPGDSGH